MNKYLAIFIGAATEEQKQDISEEQSQKFMEAWGAWAQKHSGAVVDQGAPLADTQRVDGNGISSVRNTITSYMVVQASSHQEAAGIFADHPHVSLQSGNAVEVLAFLQMPES